MIAFLAITLLLVVCFFILWSSPECDTGIQFFAKAFLLAGCFIATIFILITSSKKTDPKPVISPVNWGVVDSTLTIGDKRYEVEVGVHPDGTLQYRKGKEK